MTRIGFIRNAILNRRLTGTGGLGWAAMVLLAAFLIRLAIEPYVSGVPFLTFFPAVLVTSVLLGWRWGLATLVLAAVLANYAFQPPEMHFALEPKELVASFGFVLAAGLIISAAEALRRSFYEVTEAVRRERELNLELKHRVNNNLAVVQALAEQTARRISEPLAFRDAFTDRLMAVSEANRVLSGAGWEASPLPELAEAALKPFRPSGQIQVGGPACSLPQITCVPLALVLHELATNATKYGALSLPAGQVHLSWEVQNAVCHFTWREEQGPAVEKPTRRGMGSRLLARQSGIDQVELDFQPGGLICRIAVEGAGLRPPLA